MRSPLAVCRRRVGGLDGVNPPIAGGEARGAVRCSHVNPLLRVITRYFACGQGCLRSYYRVNVRIRGPMLVLAG